MTVTTYQSSRGGKASFGGAAEEEVTEVPVPLSAGTVDRVRVDSGAQAG
jgi:hypothetical protein